MAGDVFVISDLHLGGDPTDPAVPGGRGFRMCTQGPLLARLISGLASAGAPVELVINGDFIDFLAERDPDSGKWSAFHLEPSTVATILTTVATQREPEVFKALRRYCANKNRQLTILVGNHDVELAFPVVRRRLDELLRPRSPLKFLYGDEPYILGDTIIDHGNRSDDMNRVAWTKFQEYSSAQLRRTAAPERPTMDIAPGSELVRTIMNPIKARFPFVDLLKPETRAAIPILLALDPSLITKLPSVLALLAKGKARGAKPAQELSSTAPDITVEAALEDVLGSRKAARAFMDALPKHSTHTDLAAAGVPDSLFRALLAYLRRIRQEDGSLDLAEHGEPYIRAARTLAARGFSTVIFGHTHLAKCQRLNRTATYLNTGTWADLIFLPAGIMSDDKATSLDCLRDFLNDLRSGRLSQWIQRRPTYVWLRGKGSLVIERRLCEFSRASDDPFDLDNELRGSVAGR